MADTFKDCPGDDVIDDTTTQSFDRVQEADLRLEAAAQHLHYAISGREERRLAIRAVRLLLINAEAFLEGRAS